MHLRAYVHVFVCNAFIGNHAPIVGAATERCQHRAAQVATIPAASFGEEWVLRGHHGRLHEVVIEVVAFLVRGCTHVVLGRTTQPDLLR